RPLRRLKIDRQLRDGSGASGRQGFLLRFEVGRGIVDGHRPSVVAELMLGVVAGTAGTVAMGRVSTTIYERQSRLLHLQENMAGGGSRSHAIAAQKATGLFGVELDDERARDVGEALHFGVGASMGGLYGVVRPHLPAPSAIRGLAFGAVVWLL